VLTLFCQSLSREASPHLEAPYSDDFPRIGWDTFENPSRSCRIMRLKRGKNQINPPSTTGRTRKEKGGLVLLGSGELSPYRD
jgi:hypothetical protein